MEFDFTGFSEVIQQSLRIIFGGQIPEYVSQALAICTIALAFLIVAYVTIWLISNTIELFNEKLKPYFYDAKKKRRQIRRQRFAEHISLEITDLNNQESWADNRFTELEAEIEAQGKQKKWFSFWTSKEKLSREKSLSRALDKSVEKVILLEGEPGSGKSVALRHLAIKLSKKASRSRDLNTIIPIYINLKGLEKDGEVVDQNFIRKYILKSLNRANSVDVDSFLENEFNQGLENGIWLFLFDSFDEIPEVLSSVEADEKIRSYSEAINDFLGGFNQCRGVISSREYRGPKALSIPKFRILPLSEIRQKRLIDKINSDKIETSRIIGELGVSSPGLRSMASNPMFLSLLCEYVSQNQDFPKNSYLVYEKYIENRLNRDAERLKRRFNLTPDEVKSAAESLAYCMTAEDNLGLNPSRKDLLDALKKYNLNLGSSEHTHKLLNALEYLKIARTNGEAVSEGEKFFTFSHRRFQEYFATSVILSRPDHVIPKDLLTNGKWRETTVVLLQTQPEERLTELLVSAAEFIEASLKGLNCQGYAQEADFSSKNLISNTKEVIRWPEKLLHILGILQEGLIENGRRSLIPLQRGIDDLLSFSTIKGTLLDRKISLEVSGIASERIQEKMLESAFQTNSQWINDVAYTQTSHLPDLNPFIQKAIRRSLLEKTESGSLYQYVNSSKTFIQRLNNVELLDTFRLVSSFPNINLLNKAFSLAFLFILRHKIFLDFFGRHDFYRLTADIFIFFVVIDFVLVSVNIVSRLSKTKKAFSTFLIERVLSLIFIILLFVSMFWLFWLIEFSSADSDVSELTFPIFYLDKILFSKAVSFGRFIGVSWLFCLVASQSSLWELVATHNVWSGKYLKWYYWPLYPAFPAFNIIFKVIKQTRKTFFMALRLSGRQVVLIIIQKNRREQFQIFLIILLVSISLYFWKVSLVIAVILFLLGFTVALLKKFPSFVYYSLCMFYYIILWSMLRYLERSVRPRIREISHERSEKFFQRVSCNRYSSLSLISDGLEKREIANSDSFSRLIELIKNRIDSKNVFDHDIEYVRLLALQIENFYRNSYSDSPSYVRAFTEEYFQRFRPYFLSNRAIKVIDYVSGFLPNTLGFALDWFDRWEHSLFELQDIEDLEAFSGRIAVDLSNPRFAFLRSPYWAEKLYFLLEKSKNFKASI